MVLAFSDGRTQIKFRFMRLIVLQKCAGGYLYLIINIMQNNQAKELRDLEEMLYTDKVLESFTELVNYDNKLYLADNLNGMLVAVHKHQLWDSTLAFVQLHTKLLYLLPSIQQVIARKLDTETLWGLNEYVQYIKSGQYFSLVGNFLLYMQTQAEKRDGYTELLRFTNPFATEVLGLGIGVAA